MFSFARVSAVIGMNVDDYFADGKRWWFGLHEKGGIRLITKLKSASMPTSRARGLAISSGRRCSGRRCRSFSALVRASSEAEIWTLRVAGARVIGSAERARGPDRVAWMVPEALLVLRCESRV